MQFKLETRVYTSVTGFAVDLGRVFHSVIYSTGADEQNTLEHGELTPEQRDRKMRAKRIIKLILPAILEIASKEADLGLRSRDEERHRVEQVLDSCLRPNPESVHFKGDRGYSEDEPENEQMLRQIAPNGQDEVANEETAGHVDDDDKQSTEDVEMADADVGVSSIGPASLPDGHVNDTGNSLTQRAASDDAVAIPNVEQGDPTSARATPVLPALSNSGSTNPSTTNHDPLTPPQTDKDLLAPLARGGVAWYLEAFEPVGTTVHEKRWTGRELLRGMSEELSELDEETVNGLVDDDEKQDMQVDAAPVETLTVPTAQKKRSRPKRKRLGR
jgi:NuA3 HAT complex component NTO1